LQWKEKSEDRPTGSRLVVELTKLFHTAGWSLFRRKWARGGVALCRRKGHMISTDVNLLLMKDCARDSSDTH